MRVLKWLGGEVKHRRDTWKDFVTEVQYLIEFEIHKESIHSPMPDWERMDHMQKLTEDSSVR